MNNDYQATLDALMAEKQAEVRPEVMVDDEIDVGEPTIEEVGAVPKRSIDYEPFENDDYDSTLDFLNEEKQKEEDEAIPGLGGYLQTAGHIGEAIGAGVLTDIGKVYNFFAKHLGKTPVTLPELKTLKYPRFAKGVAEFAPYLAPWVGAEAVAGRLGMAAVKALPKIPKTAELIGKTIGYAGYGAGAMGALQKVFGNDSDEENVKDAMIAGALLNTVPRAIFGAVPFGLRGLVNHFKAYSKKTGKIPTPEEADALVAGLGHENVLSFGDLVKAPWLRSLYHGFLKYVPFSGVAKQQSNAVASIEDKSAGFINDLLHKGSNKLYEIRLDIADKIRRIAMENYGKSKEMYRLLYEGAKDKLKDFIPEQLKIFRDELREEGASVGKSLSEYLTPSELKDLNALNKEASSVVIGGKEVGLEVLPPNVRKQLIQRGEGVNFERISDYRSKFAKKATDKIGTRVGRFYNRLVESLDQDVIAAIEKSGDKELLAEKRKVSDYYRDHVVPFLKPKDMSEIIGKKFPVNETRLENILTSGKHTKVLDYLPEKEKDLLTRLLFERRLPDVDKAEQYAIEKILSKARNLSDYEKDYILTEGAKNKLASLEKSYDLLKPAINATKTNIFKMIHRLGALRHGAYLAGVGAFGYATHSPTLTAAIFGSGPAVARLLRSRKLIEAYTRGGPVPWERGARVIEPYIRRAGILSALAGLRGERPEDLQEIPGPPEEFGGY